MHHTFVRSWFQAALALGFIAVALSTRAEIAAPSRALEPGVGVGYHQGFGPVGAGVPTLQALDPAPRAGRRGLPARRELQRGPTVGVALTGFLSQEAAGGTGNTTSTTRGSARSCSQA